MNGLAYLLLGVLALFVLAGLSLLAGRGQRRQRQEMQERLEALRGALALAAEEGGPGRVIVEPRATPHFLELWLARADVTLPLQRLIAAGLILAGVAAIEIHGPDLR